MNKLNYHVNVWTDPARGTVRTQRNGMVLKVISTAIDRAEILRWKQANPNGQVVYRQYFPLGDPWHGESLDNVPGRCDLLLLEVAPIRDLVDIIETPWNEAHQNIHERLREYTQATITGAVYLRERWPEVKIAVGNFSVGNPPNLWADWEVFLPALLFADYLSLHEYGSPAVWSEPNDPDSLYRNRNHPRDEALGWWTLRYRRVWNWLTENYPNHRRPILITECGRDHGLTKGKVAGWRAHGGDDPYDYATELQWYADELAKDAYVHGATIYACGTYEDFASFDVGAVGEVERVVNESINGPALWYPSDDVAPVDPPTPPDDPIDDQPIMWTEIERYAADVFKRAAGFTGQAFGWHKGHAIPDHWVTRYESGSYLGFPLEPPHDSEDGVYVVQAFTNVVVRWHKATGGITEVAYRPLAHTPS